MGFPGWSFPAHGEVKSPVPPWQNELKNLVSIRLQRLLSPLSIRQKIACGYALSIGIVVLGTGTGLLLGGYYRQQVAEKIVRAEAQENLLSQIKTTAIQARSHQQQLFFLLNHPKQFEYKYYQVQSDINRIKTLLVQVKSSKTNLFRNSAQEIVDWERWLQTYERTPETYSQRLELLVEQIAAVSVKSDTMPAAQALLLEFNHSDVALELEQLTQDLTKLIEASNRENAEVTATLDRIEVAQNQIVAVSTLLSIAIAAAIATYISEAIARPIKTSTQVAQKVAQEANFSLQVPSTTEDEIGQLASSLNQLLQRVANDTQELKQTQSDLDRFFNLSLDMFCIVDGKGYFKRLNDAFETALGYTHQELLSTPVLNLVHPDDREATIAETQKLMAGATVSSFENRYRCQDGSYKWLVWTAVFFAPENLIYAVARDISDRKQTEERLLRIRKALESTSDAIGMADVTGRSIYHNPAFIDLFEYTVDELTAAGGPPAIYANLTDAETVFAAIESGDSWRGELAMKSRRGRIMQIAVRADAIKDETGQIIGLIGIHTDITDRQRIEEELRQSEAKYRELANREALLNRLANQIRRSLDINTILETTVHEIRNLLQIDRCLFVWYRPNVEEPVWEVVQEAKTSTFPSMISYCVPVTAFGPLAARIFNKEITRVDCARNLTNSVERKFFFSMGYTALLTLPIHTTSGKIGAVSCGHSSGPRPWRDSEVELLQAVANQIAIAIDQGELYKQSRLAAKAAQEHSTQLENTLRQLRQTQAQLVQSEKMSSLGQLVAGVAHEINNPIGFIYGNLIHTNQYAEDLLHLVQLYQQHYPHPAAEIQAKAEAIDLDFMKEDLPKILSSMEIGVDRIRRIVLSLRNFSRLDQAEMKWVDIHDGLDNTLMILAHRLKSQLPEYPGIQVIKDYGNLPQVQCYAGQLNQVFMNILSNAIEAIEEFNKKQVPATGAGTPNVASASLTLTPKDLKNNSGTIWICTDVLDDQAVILIGDNGIGMTPEVCRRLFDPFFTTKPVGSGTGLGMSISYQIVVEKHRGQLQCISAPSRGTAFLIQIPIQQKKQNLPYRETDSDFHAWQEQSSAPILADAKIDPFIDR